jgi:hypothetical protein
VGRLLAPLPVLEAVAATVAPLLLTLTVACASLRPAGLAAAVAVAAVETATVGVLLAVVETATVGVLLAVVETATVGVLLAAVETATVGVLLAAVETATVGVLLAAVEAATVGVLLAAVALLPELVTLMVACSRSRPVMGRRRGHESWVASMIHGTTTGMA